MALTNHSSTGPQTAIPKVTGRMLRAVHVNISVDMGNALALKILCLALHLIVRYSVRVPILIAMKAYMDDSNAAGEGKQWLQRAQAMCTALTTMGLRIAEHTRIKMKGNENGQG